MTKHALIIEDEKDIAALIASALELEGFKTTLAFSGEIGFYQAPFSS